jgi:hypothetical protein
MRNGNNYGEVATYLGDHLNENKLVDYYYFGRYKGLKARKQRRTKLDKSTDE